MKAGNATTRMRPDQDLRHRLKDPRYCKRKKLKADHIDYCKKFRDALIGFVDVLEGRLVRIDGQWVEPR